MCAPTAFLAVAEVRSRENDPASRVLGWRGVDFVAATAMFQALAATLALLLTMKWFKPKNRRSDKLGTSADA
jgi:hypothetical protein